MLVLILFQKKSLFVSETTDLNHVSNINDIDDRETVGVKLKAGLDELKLLVNTEDLQKKIRKASFAKAIPHIVHELLYLTSSVNSKS